MRLAHGTRGVSVLSPLYARTPSSPAPPAGQAWDLPGPDVCHVREAARARSRARPQQQQAGRIQRSPGRRQRRRLDHQARVLDHEFGHCPAECIQRRNTRHAFSMAPILVTSRRPPRSPHMPRNGRDSAAGPVARDTSALVPEVAFLHDQPVSPKTEQRHPGQILVTAVGQPGLRAPRNGCLITIDNWLAKPALRRFLLREHAG
jgi:hypothetical protein